ncbi:MAG: hypothetical protein ACRC7R_07230 [Sarcina sp.]
MTRGRKKIDNPKQSRVISFRIPLEEFEILEKNPWIKKELKKELSHFLANYKQK